MTDENPYPKGTVEHDVFEQMPKKSTDDGKFPIGWVFFGVLLLMLIVSLRVWS